MLHVQRISKPFGDRQQRQVHGVRSAASRTTSVRVRAGAEYDSLKSLVVLKASNGEPVEILKLWEVCDMGLGLGAFGNALHLDDGIACDRLSKMSQQSVLAKRLSEAG
jgi:hypothetical protein